jgi:transmembrane sensor
MPPRKEPTKAQRDQAALWLARRAGGSVTDEEEKVFHAWIAAEPGNRAAYEEAADLWLRLETPAKNLAQQVPALRSWGGPVWRAAQILPAIAVLIVIFCVASVDFSSFTESQADLITARGEQSLIPLPDGSDLTIGPDSALDLDFAGRRWVLLRRGEAYFQIRSGLTMPFIIDVDDARVKVVGTKLDIDRLDSRTIVTVVEGSVEIRDHQAHSVHVDRGSRAIIHDGIVGDAHPADIEAATAWISKRLVFANAQLADVIAAFRRRTAGRILLLGDHAETTVSGTFPADDVDASLDTIARATGVQIRRFTPWLTILY